MYLAPHFREVLVIGGGGFVGRHLVAALSAQGLRVTVPSRRRERVRELLPLPTVEVLQADVNERRTLAALVRGRDAVINLAGVLHSRRGTAGQRGPNDYGPDFARAHVELPLAVIAACRRNGVRRLLHVSALGAAPRAPSEYLRSKGIGEQTVLATDDLDVTVVRPSAIFGPGDGLLGRMARLAARLPMLALPCAQARFQPVYVGDVVRVLLASLARPAAAERSYDLCGPREYTLRELARYACRATGRRRIVLGIPQALSYPLAALLESSGLMTRDNLRSMQVPNVCAACAPLPFGLAPTPLEALGAEVFA